MNLKPVTLTALFKARPGKESELRSTLIGLIAPTRKEEGCINYDLHASTEDPAQFIFYENWKTMADLDRHGETAHIKALLDRIEDLCLEFKLSYWERIG
jgi:quinol monooxygenase YgiN